MWQKILIISISIIFSFTVSISAVFADNDIKVQDEWEPVSAGPITTWTAPLCGRGEFVIQPLFFYNRTRGTFNSEGHYGSLPKGDKKYQYQQQLFMQYSLRDRLEIDGQLFYQENYEGWAKVAILHRLARD